eukprot:4520458-Prymnesium_polylepis.1
MKPPKRALRFAPVREVGKVRQVRQVRHSPLVPIQGARSEGTRRYQDWHFPPDGQLKPPTAPSFCASARGGDGAPGAPGAPFGNISNPAP